MPEYEEESEQMTNSVVESLSFSDREDCSTDQIELPAPTNHNTAGRVLCHGVKYQKAKDELQKLFQNQIDFELAQWFIEAKVPKEHIDWYFKKGLRPENSTIKSAYHLLEAVDELELGMGIKSWKEGFTSFSELVSTLFRQSIQLTQNRRLKTEIGWR